MACAPSIYLPFHALPRNAVATVRDLSLQVGATTRQPNLPVFVNADGSAVTGKNMATGLHRAMRLIFTPQRAKLYTWHSARISLATLLAKCKVPAKTIQATMRWQTADSLRAYARLSMDDCANMLDRATKATIAAVQTPNIPIYEQFDFFLALNEIAEAV